MISTKDHLALFLFAYNRYHNFKPDINGFVQTTQINTFIKLMSSKLSAILGAYKAINSGVIQGTNSQLSDNLNSAAGLLKLLPFGEYIATITEAVNEKSNKRLKSARNNIADALALNVENEDIPKISQYIAYRLAYTLQEQLFRIAPKGTADLVDTILYYYRTTLVSTGIVVPTIAFDPRHKLAIVIEQLFQAFFQPPTARKLTPYPKVDLIDDTKNHSHPWTVPSMMSKTGIMVDNNDGSVIRYVNQDVNTKYQKYGFRVLSKDEFTIYAKTQRLQKIDTVKIKLLSFDKMLTRHQHDSESKVLSQSLESKQETKTRQALEAKELTRKSDALARFNQCHGAYQQLYMSIRMKIEHDKDLATFATDSLWTIHHRHNIRFNEYSKIFNAPLIDKIIDDSVDQQTALIVDAHKALQDFEKKLLQFKQEVTQKMQHERQLSNEVKANIDKFNKLYGEYNLLYTQIYNDIMTQMIFSSLISSQQWLNHAQTHALFQAYQVQLTTIKIEHIDSNALRAQVIHLSHAHSDLKRFKLEMEQLQQAFDKKQQDVIQQKKMNNIMLEFHALYQRYITIYDKLNNNIAQEPELKSFQTNQNWLQHKDKQSEFTKTFNQIEILNQDKLQSSLAQLTKSLDDLHAIELEVTTQQFIATDTMPLNTDETLASKVRLLVAKLQYSEMTTAPKEAKAPQEDLEIKTTYHDFLSRHFHFTKKQCCSRNQFTVEKATVQLTHHHDFAIEVDALEDEKKIEKQCNDITCQVQYLKEQPVRVSVKGYLVMGGKLTAGIIANSNHPKTPKFILKILSKFVGFFKKLFSGPIQKALSLDLSKPADLDTYLRSHYNPAEGQYIIDYWHEANHNLIKKSPEKCAARLLDAYQQEQERLEKSQLAQDNIYAKAIKQNMALFPEAQQETLMQIIAPAADVKPVMKH